MRSVGDWGDRREDRSDEREREEGTKPYVLGGEREKERESGDVFVWRSEREREFFLFGLFVSNFLLTWDGLVGYIEGKKIRKVIIWFCLLILKIYVFKNDSIY